MTTVPSYFPSTHDGLLARCHSERGDRVRDSTPKLMSSFDYEPAARCTDSMADDLLPRTLTTLAVTRLQRTHANPDKAALPDFQRCASAEDSTVLARRYSSGRMRSAMFVPKLMSALDGYPAAHEGVEHHAFSPLPSDAASAAFTITSSSSHDELLARCHSDRSHRLRASTPKLMSSFDYDARNTDSDMTDYTFLRV